MRKQLFIFISMIIAVLGLSAMCIACGGDGGKNTNDPNAEKAVYSVTVYSPDDEPLSGITVSWRLGSNVVGSAETDSDGYAAANLPRGTYSVKLDGYAAGLSCDDVTVSSTMREIFVTLRTRIVTYTATVLDKSGAPAVGVTVSWTDGKNIVGTAVTGADGKTACDIAYGEYTVTLANLPDGNLLNADLTATGENPNVTTQLINGVAETYTVTVKSEGGLLFKKQAVMVYRNNKIFTSGITDDNGVYSFSAQDDAYMVRVEAMPTEGYTAKSATLSAFNRAGEIVLHSEVIKTAPTKDTYYVIGDIIHDYSFTTPYDIDGAPKTYTISELLKTKDAVIINNWGTQCSNCMLEMAAMNEAFETYKDSIQIIAASNYYPLDSDQVIINYHNQHPDYNIPMMADYNGLASKFNLTGWPTTVVIDRYGAIARIEVGAVFETEAWGRMIEKYIGDDYVQTFIMGDKTSESINSEMAKPDIKLDDDHYEKLAEVLQDESTFPEGASIEWHGMGEEEDGHEYAWPFIYDVVEGVSDGDEMVVYSSNTGKANSFSFVYAEVTVDPGYVFTFDYFADTEDDDVLNFVWDSKIIKEIYGNSNGWKTCYLYADIIGGTHTLSLMYLKDSSGNTGKDNVYLRNVRFVAIKDIDEPTDMLRAAAYGKPEEGATEFLHYAKVELKSDGYYHVKTSELENSQYAGEDDSPMLFVNMLNVTNWSIKYSLNDYINARDASGKNYAYNCTFDIGDGLKDYRNVLIKHLNAATASDIYGFMPVDKELHDLLVKFMAGVSGRSLQDKEWLEACYFYSHYGDTNFIGNPVIGLLEKTAIPVAVDTETNADITRKTPPFPSVIYTFTAPSDGVYKIQSKLPDSSSQAAQMWLYDDKTTPDTALVHDGDLRFIRDGVNEQNFTVYRYMKTGEKYYLQLAFLMNESGKYKFEINKVGESATVLLPCSDNIFTYEVDEKDEPIGDPYLLGAVDYELGTDGYYHVKNVGGDDDFIYLDVKYATYLTYYSISQLLTQKQRDPETLEALDYNVFNLQYIVAYMSSRDPSGEPIYLYNPKVDLKAEGALTAEQKAKCKDYTQFLTDYIANPANQGPEDGLVKVNQDIVELLSLFIELRINGVTDGEIEAALDNEWLRFCWYYRTYDVTHP